jgi:hypothetical protein
LGSYVQNGATCRCHCTGKGDCCPTDELGGRRLLPADLSTELAHVVCMKVSMLFVCTPPVHVACRSCLHRLIRFAIVLVRANSRFVDFKFSSLRFLTAKSQETARESKRTLRSLHLHRLIMASYVTGQKNGHLDSFVAPFEVPADGSRPQNVGIRALVILSNVAKAKKADLCRSSTSLSSKNLVHANPSYRSLP